MALLGASYLCLGVLLICQEWRARLQLQAKSDPVTGVMAVTGSGKSPTGSATVGERREELLQELFPMVAVGFM